jgi:hypothetical protein
MTPPLPNPGHRLASGLFRLLLAAPFFAAWPAVAKPDKAEIREIKREMNTDPFGGKPRKPDDKPEAKTNRSNLSEVENRSLDKLREYLEVTDDAEWELIAARVIKVGELRNTLWTGSSALRGNPSAGDKRTTRPGVSAHPEQDAIRSALKDKLPDAEIKMRLARARETYQQNQARLTQAQEELRAVLTVRQEAVAVMAGLLPP